ncbi:helix-hairpin-helix domain-containing protein [Sediminibacterium goheungense]|uniref:DNA uptake protein ComE-like DNA-binding protein n=1 Tax=Sediminibacterium goheungense TaxID=1086393 RepID=A0A4R6J0F4_9BACT|nr:helix-hairpin-helix domain-containing protein [Sediminibacterium goheungense]TDO28679.1 DNA uptake protein ComE-like DNA-binding protein [Sediminibacterium goheungense]
MKKRLRPYFNFSKKERTGVVVLISICLLLVVSPRFFPSNELVYTDLDLSAGVQWLDANENVHTTKTELVSGEGKQDLFFFNPNTLDEEGWKKLGLHEKLAQRILHYRNKGGHFYKPADIKKIWGLDSTKAKQLIPYVVLPAVEERKVLSKPAIPIIDINTADQEAWKALPGIGEVLAARIVAYRTKVAGFARLEELQSVFGLSDSLVSKLHPYIRVHPASIPRLWLNRASAHQIEQKTGIPLQLAQLIVRKRQENGNYGDWTELKEIAGMQEGMIEKLRLAFRLE